MLQVLYFVIGMLALVQAESNQTTVETLQDRNQSETENLQDWTRRKLGHAASTSSSGAVSQAKLISTHTMLNPYGAVWKQGPFTTIQPGFPSLENKQALQYAKPWGTAGGQWCGWKFPQSPNGPKWQYYIRLSAWVAFKDKVPQPSNNFGFKITGTIRNEWVRGMAANQWKWISIVEKITTNGDGNHVLYIFDSIQEDQEVYLSGMKLEVFDDKVNPELKQYYQSNKLGAIEQPKATTSRSGYYASKATVEKSNYVQVKKAAAIPGRSNVKSANYGCDGSFTLTVKNLRSKQITIFWHDFDGNLIEVKKLDSQQQITPQVCPNHVYSAYETKSKKKLWINAKQEFLVNSNQRTAIIRTDAQVAACSIDEAKNRLGSNRCSRDNECSGDRYCSGAGWCNGDSNCNKFTLNTKPATTYKKPVTYSRYVAPVYRSTSESSEGGDAIGGIIGCCICCGCCGFIMKKVCGGKQDEGPAKQEDDPVATAQVAPTPPEQAPPPMQPQPNYQPQQIQPMMQQPPSMAQPGPMMMGGMVAQQHFSTTTTTTTSSAQMFTMGGAPMPMYGQPGMQPGMGMQPQQTPM